MQTESQEAKLLVPNHSCKVWRRPSDSRRCPPHCTLPPSIVWYESGIYGLPNLQGKPYEEGALSVLAYRCIPVLGTHPVFTESSRSWMGVLILPGSGAKGWLPGTPEPEPGGTFCLIFFLKMPLPAISWSFSPCLWPSSPVPWLLLPFLHPSEETELVPDPGRGSGNQHRPRQWHFPPRAWTSEAAKSCFKSIFCHLFGVLICHMERLVTSPSECWGTNRFCKVSGSQKTLWNKREFPKALLPGCRPEKPEQLMHFGFQRTGIIFTVLQKPWKWRPSKLPEFSQCCWSLGSKEYLWMTKTIVDWLVFQFKKF